MFTTVNKHNNDLVNLYDLTQVYTFLKTHLLKLDYVKLLTFLSQTSSVEYFRWVFKVLCQDNSCDNNPTVVTIIL